MDESGAIFLTPRVAIDLKLSVRAFSAAFWFHKFLTVCN